MTTNTGQKSVKCPQCKKRRWPKDCTLENCPAPPKETPFDEQEDYAQVVGGYDMDYWR